MRQQRKGYWCGIASIANALEVLGIRRTQREIAKLCVVTEGDDEDPGDGTYDPGGTDETEMKRALLANRVTVDEWSDTDVGRSVGWAHAHASTAGPVILCVDDDEHWVTVIGTCGVRMLVFDPARNSGIEVHTQVSLAARWVNQDGVYYGMGVRP